MKAPHCYSAEKSTNPPPPIRAPSAESEHWALAHTQCVLWCMAADRLVRPGG